MQSPKQAGALQEGSLSKCQQASFSFCVYTYPSIKNNSTIT